jgi:hypothetical protein
MRRTAFGGFRGGGGSLSLEVHRVAKGSHWRGVLVGHLMMVVLVIEILCHPCWALFEFEHIFGRSAVFY